MSKTFASPSAAVAQARSSRGSVPTQPGGEGDGADGGAVHDSGNENGERKIPGKPGRLRPDLDRGPTPRLRPCAGANKKRR